MNIIIRMIRKLTGKKPAAKKTAPKASATVTPLQDVLSAIDGLIALLGRLGLPKQQVEDYAVTLRSLKMQLGGTTPALNAGELYTTLARVFDRAVPVILCGGTAKEKSHVIDLVSDAVDAVLEKEETKIQTTVLQLMQVMYEAEILSCKSNEMEYSDKLKELDAQVEAIAGDGHRLTSGEVVDLRLIRHEYEHIEGLLKALETKVSLAKTKITELKNRISDLKLSPLGGSLDLLLSEMNGYMAKLPRWESQIDKLLEYSQLIDDSLAGMEADNALLHNTVGGVTVTMDDKTQAFGKKIMEKKAAGAPETVQAPPAVEAAAETEPQTL